MANPSNNLSTIKVGSCEVDGSYGFAYPIVNGWTYHHLITVISAALTILTCIFSFGLSMQHLLNFSNPLQQKQIVRIVLTPAVFALFNFFMVWFYSVAAYLEPVPALYEVFALVALFYLFVIYVTPDEDRRESFFDSLALIDRSTRTAQNGRGSLQWFYVIWAAVFQILISHFATFVVREVLQATRCFTDSRLRKDTTIVSVVEAITTVICLGAIIRFYRRLKPQLQNHQPILKMISLKLIVLIQLVQNAVFTGLASHGDLKPTKYASYLDLSIGTPGFMTCVETVIFSALMLWPFRATPYTRSHHRTQQAMGAAGYITSWQKKSFGAAMLDVLNVWDIISGLGMAIDFLLNRDKLTNRTTSDYQTEVPHGGVMEVSRPERQGV